MGWFLSPSGEISCPRLSSCMQDIKMKGEFGRHSSSFPLSVSPGLNKIIKNLVPGCSVVVFITIWKQYVVSTHLVVRVAGLFVNICLVIWWNFFPSTEGSVHSNDSLSDSSPPAPGVPTQVVQPVQTTQQVRCTWTAWLCFVAAWEQVTTDGWAKFHLTLWLYSSAEVSVASGVAGGQEDSDWPHQQPAVCAHQPGGK